MKPYSNDLRSRIVEAYENGEGSLRESVLYHFFRKVDGGIEGKESF